MSALRICSLTFVLTCVSLGLAQATLLVMANVSSVYRQGEAGSIDFSLVLNDPEATVSEGVLFLNIVERDAARNWPQAAHLIFASAQERESVFRVPFSGETLRAGLKTSLEFKLRDRAKPGDYALVIQLYRGNETDPGRVRVADRIAMQSFDFSVTAP